MFYPYEMNLTSLHGMIGYDNWVKVKVGGNEMTTNTHLHVTTWVLGLILFVVVLMLHKQGKGKGAKIVHMILRLDFLLILISGVMLLSNYLKHASGGTLGEVIVKALAGIWVIVALEMITTNTAKGKPVKSGWIQLIIAFLITIMLGFGRLGLGVQWF